MDKSTIMDASDIASGSLYLTVQSVLTNLISIFGITYLARMITQDQMGMLAALTLVTTFINSTFDFGLTSSLPKFVSELKGRGEDFSAHVMAVILFKASVTVLPCLALFVFSTQVSATLFGTIEGYYLIWIAAIDSFILSLTPIFHSVLLGTAQFKKIAFSALSSNILKWIVIVILLASGYGIYGAVIGYVSGSLILLLLYVVMSSRLVKNVKDAVKRCVSLIPTLLIFSWPLYASTLISFLYASYDKAIVLAFLPLTDLGIYDVSYKAFTVLATLASALGSALYPFYGMAYGKNNHEAISSGIKKATRYMAIIIFPLALGLFSTAKPVITLFAGYQYQSGWPILATLAIFGLVYGLLPAFTGLLVIYEKTKTVLFLNIASVALSLSLLPLLSILGLNGLAVIRGASFFSTFLLTVYFLSKTVKLEIDMEAVSKALFSSTIMATAVLMLQQVHYSLTFFPLYVFAGATVYFVCIRLLKTLNEADIQFIEKTVGKKIAKTAKKILVPKTKNR